MAKKRATDLQEQVLEAFVALADKYNSAGWIEYLLWETLGGKRDRPFSLLDPLTDEELDVLRLLRDELKIWPFWNFQESQWAVSTIQDWEAHAEKRSAQDVRNEMGLST